MSSLHQHAKDVFLAALARPSAERAQFLNDACGTDVALRQEVESLLAFHSGTDAGDLGARRPDPPSTGRLEPNSFKPGEIFAGRYRMVTRIGRGGMGDVWRADDLVLDCAVALKLIRFAGPDGREQLLNEVRLARLITHPAVCRVFDVGTFGDEVFYSMELVQGENLASLIRRVGRLPSVKVLDIARQLCDGLAVAHARGVLHRDLKPANILIDDEGRVRITDFGIAISPDGTRRPSMFGTLGYMAPEQLTPGAKLSERTDLYALGVILYELVVGQHPANHDRIDGQPPRPSTLVPEVDPRLERVIQKALQPDAEMRPVSAEEMANALRRPNPAPVRTRRWIWASALAALVFVAAALGWAFLRTEGARPLTEQDTIVLADFTNSTGEPVFDGTLKVALAVALEQSPFLKVFPDDRVRETLRLMDRSGDEPLTRSLAREVAQREQLKALISGSIAGLGRHYVLALEAINAQTGDVMAREQVEANSKEEVLTALGGAASSLRVKLGESLASIKNFDAPLARATTSSLAALHAYSLALDKGTVNPRLESIPHLKRAIELDPEFALALALMATTYANTGQTTLASDYARKAFELRDRVSERERFFISFRYYRDATQDWAQALELTRLWTTTYPREAFAFNSFGTALSRFGEHEQALVPFREAIRLDPRFAPPYTNLATSLIALNRYEDAGEVLRQALGRGLDFVGVRRLSYLLAFIGGDTAAMKQYYDTTLADRDGTAHGWRGHASAFAGQINDAHEQFRQGIRMALQEDFKEVAAQMGVEDAEAHAIVGQCAETRRELEQALASSRDNFTLERGSRAAALCGDEPLTTALVREIEERYKDATITIRVAVPITQAALAVTRGQNQRALDLLEPVRQYEHAQKAELWPPYLRGQAHLAMKDAAAAKADFEAVLAHRGDDPDSELYALAHLGLARAALLQNDRAAAASAFQRFETAWKDSDVDMPAVREIRAQVTGVGQGT
jgi:tetratricopeptide (TPR) repeat protein